MTSAALENLRAAMTPSHRSGAKPRWTDVHADFLTATSSPLSPTVENLLLRILRSEEELNLDNGFDMPHRMSPENMLKSMAVQALGRWTGATYLPTMKRLEATARSASLACAIRAVIRDVTAKERRTSRIDAVAEVHAIDLTNEMRMDFGDSGRIQISNRQRGDRTYLKALPVLSAFGFSLEAAPPKGDCSETLHERRQAIAPGIEE